MILEKYVGKTTTEWDCTHEIKIVAFDGQRCRIKSGIVLLHKGLPHYPNVVLDAS